MPEDLPKGALLTGLPGTGKSLIARAAAATWRLPLLRLDMSRILGSLVGQSENRMRDALRLAEAMAPCVLHVDEIEKALAGAGTDTNPQTASFTAVRQAPASDARTRPSRPGLSRYRSPVASARRTRGDRARSRSVPVIVRVRARDHRAAER